jgi:hypothetical protein
MIFNQLQSPAAEPALLEPSEEELMGGMKR